MNIFLMLIIIVEVVLGLVSTFYVIGSLFWVLGQKIYRKCKYHASLYD